MHVRFAASVMLLAALIPFAPSMGQPASSITDDEQKLKEAKLGTDGPALLDFLRGHLLTETERTSIDSWIKTLGDEDFATRETAHKMLMKMGFKAIAPLEAAAKGRNAEGAARAVDCIRELDVGPNGRAVTGPLVESAVRLLAIRKPAKAAEVLLDYLAVADQNAREEIATTLVIVAKRDGKPEPALVQGLTSADPMRRAMAGEVLTRAGLAETKAAVRRLLDDKDTSVRLRVGMALAYAQEKDAVPTLIDLLAKAELEDAWRIEDLLHRLAGEKAPAANLGVDSASRAKCRDAWVKWWDAQAGDIDMAVLDARGTTLGFTFMVSMTGCKVFEVDRRGNVRWQITSLNGPFDGHLLPGNRVLTAEYGLGVFERDLKGKILWKKEFPNAVQCQRLPNGNTFVVTLNNLVEVDPKGNTTVRYTHPNNNSLMAARKLPDGKMITVAMPGVLLRLDTNGSVLNQWDVPGASSCSLEILPNGNLLVARQQANKITEYDLKGKVIRETDFPNASSTQRLPNGHTIVASHLPARAVELDRAGKVVWEYKMDQQHLGIYRATRR